MTVFGNRPSGPDGAAHRPGRIVLLDAIRGLAILGMILFHLDWDLANFGYVRTAPNLSVSWTLLGNGVAAVFLMLSGMGLVLARSKSRGPALRRLSLIAGCAALVTGVTTWLFPQEAIGFGILHCIATTNAIALVLLRRPIFLLLVLSAVSMAAPLLLATGSTEGAPWWWIGLSLAPPQTLDYRPVLPWLGVVLLGVVAARTLPLQHLSRPLRGWAKPFASAGRHSLLIYMVHQPILFGLLWLLHLGLPPQQAESFMPACQAECQAAGAGMEGCRTACLCAAQAVGGASAQGAAPIDPTTVARTCLRQTD